MFSISHELELYFELKGTPESSRESYARRVDAFVKFLQGKDKSADEAVTRDVQEYILYLKREKGLSAGTINTYISS
ncbi:MAG: Site-specific recombinase XerD, partial [Bacillota bacterium]